MNKPSLEIKLGFIVGLLPVVMNEVQRHPDFRVLRKEEEFVYLSFTHDFSNILGLRSASRAYVVNRDQRFNPHYVSKHKSVLGDIIRLVMANQKNAFSTFKLICAGSGSESARSIAEYIHNTYRLEEAEDADLKVHIIKTGTTWEIGAQMTPRPLSSREYRVRNMEGAMDATIAYAVNSMCELSRAQSYLNVFSGSATLLIEAAQCYPNLRRMVGFDNNKEAITTAVQNVRKAGVMSRIQMKEADIYDQPDLGTFDVITSDLPFGMLVSKGENLDNLYRSFINYCQAALHPAGRLVVYTSEYKTFRKIIAESPFVIVNTLELKLISSTKTRLYPQIIICKFRNK